MFINYSLDCTEFYYLIDITDLEEQRIEWEERLQIAGERLAKKVRIRDRLRRQQNRLCAAMTVLLKHISKLSFYTKEPLLYTTLYFVK